VGGLLGKESLVLAYGGGLLPLVALAHALLNRSAPLVEDEGDNDDESNDEEPNELGSDAFFRLIAELSCPAFTAEALTVAARAAIHANTTAGVP